MDKDTGILPSVLCMCSRIHPLAHMYTLTHIQRKQLGKCLQSSILSLTNSNVAGVSCLSCRIKLNHPQHGIIELSGSFSLSLVPSAPPCWTQISVSIKTRAPLGDDGGPLLSGRWFCSMCRLPQCLSLMQLVASPS